MVHFINLAVHPCILFGVDSKLKVKGVKGLRVIDTSVYPSPNLHAYNPSRGIYMIAEMMADQIKMDA